VKIKLLLISTILCISIHAEKKYNIGVLIVATWKYISFIPPLLESARKYFVPEHNVSFFIFTDQYLTNSNDVKRLDATRKGWPHDTLMRYHEYLKYENEFKNMDYLFACDADILFTDHIGEEVLGNRVAIPHDVFLGRRGTYENSSKSSACVHNHEGVYYFSGAFVGGQRDSFLKMCKNIKQLIDVDLSKGIIAVHNDESYLNRELINNPPTIVLSTCYGWPDNREPRVKPKMLFLSKKHSEFQVPLKSRRR